MTAKVMKILDRESGHMQCSVCGAEHWANIRPLSSGRYYRGAWQCINGCKLPERARAVESRYSTNVE
jgi:hypothetical protein